MIINQKEEKMNSKNLLLLFVLFLLCIVPVRLFSQDMQPKPLDNKVYDAMVGTWLAQSDMMGMKMNQEVVMHWGLGHQFLMMEMTATGVNDPKISYSGLGMFGADEKGNLKAWWFDNWGASAMSTGTGAFGDNKITVNDGNEMFKETRTFEVKGDQLVMSAKGTMTYNGKETPFEETATYKRK
jgi:hypothetical protein